MRNTNRAMLPELEEMQVYGETQVGWDENTPPNETVDADGNLFPENRGFGVSDPNSPNRRVYDDPDVEALRARLRQHNGIRGFEICAPTEVKKAARIFRRDGFVVVKDLLNAEQLARWREGCAEALRDSRAWHGATPNLSKEIRALPNVEYAAPWRTPHGFTKSMPHEIWKTLTPHAQKLCKWIKADP